MVTDAGFDERESEIARYRILAQEVTDPLAARLLHHIVIDLEADLLRDRAASAVKSDG
ncbi:hypothetical protein [Bradyrhizobium iriomotense]|jgi:hypothetical protein|uniref:Uncharacterized protein n=1 Tax=Bradyrhizobium iriomotense TaxID=441950 RepID=A0ABQ6ATV1_9BRAD|nr:hypothetical protein [Bradyrhizobium iriomotense]GLR83333.1 hypothetical protein GCM10007857_00430 [Bradyrhizobium iriomotense]